MEKLQSHRYMTNGLLIYIVKYLRISSYIRKPFFIYLMNSKLFHSEFPYIGGKFDFLFISAYCSYNDDEQGH
jgi:hypothetical protein